MGPVGWLEAFWEGWGGVGEPWGRGGGVCGRCMEWEGGIEGGGAVGWQERVWDAVVVVALAGELLWSI